MESNNFYHIEYSDYCLHLYCYAHNVSTGMSFSLLQQNMWPNGQDVWLESASVRNHSEVAGSIRTKDKITKNTNEFEFC